MIVICGKTIKECEESLKMAKIAMATGAPMGCGGATMADAEKAMEAMKMAMGIAEPKPTPTVDDLIEEIYDMDLDEKGIDELIDLIIDCCDPRKLRTYAEKIKNW